MSKITKKLAVAIATEMVARIYNDGIQYMEERLSNALTGFAITRIPKEVLDFIRNYPEFITTTMYMGIVSTIGGKKVYLQGRVNIPIPNKPLYYAIGEQSYKAFRDLQERIIELRRNRADRHKELFELIYDCGSTKKLEKEFPEAYRVMLEIKVLEEAEK